MTYVTAQQKSFTM